MYLEEMLNNNGTKVLLMNDYLRLIFIKIVQQISSTQLIT